MNLLILGGSGRTGLHLITEALERGYHVKALVRDPHSISIQHPELELIQGSPYNAEDLARAAEGCSAVASSLNLSRTSDWPWAKLRSPLDLLSKSMAHLIALDKKRPFVRVVVCTAHGVKETREQIPGWFRWVIEHSNIRYPYADHERQEDLMKASTMNWVVVRPVGLSNGKSKESVIVSFNNQPKPTLTIPRVDVAKFMMDTLQSGEYLHQTPTISGK
ncbi:MAG: SDR family oxidoreductase [Bacteroidia bacterium]